MGLTFISVHEEKKDRPPRGGKTPRTPGTRENGNAKGEGQKCHSPPLIVWRLVLNRSRKFSCVFGVLAVFKPPGRSFSSGSLFNQPNTSEHCPEFLPSLLAKFRAPYQFADQQRIVTQGPGFHEFVSRFACLPIIRLIWAGIFPFRFRRKLACESLP